MDLSDLTCFLMVVREGGVSRAAEKLHRFQSNVTARIQKLEREIGTELFIREGRSMRLSAKGRTFLDYAKQMIALDDRMRLALSDDVTPRGLLRLGAMESTAASRLPEALARFHSCYPRVELELVTGPTRKLLTQLGNGELDAAFIADTGLEHGIVSCAVFEEELSLITPEPRKVSDAPEELVEANLITFARGCSYRSLLEDWFRHYGARPKAVFEISSYHAIISCVAAGTGISLVPKSTLASLSYPAQIGVAPFLFRPTMHTLMVWREGEESAAVRALRQEILGNATASAMAAGEVKKRRGASSKIKPATAV